MTILIYSWTFIDLRKINYESTFFLLSWTMNSFKTNKNTVYSIEDTSWKVRAYGIYARIVDVSKIERVSVGNERDFWYKKQRVRK